jgi:hypothetical protein
MTTPAHDGRITHSYWIHYPEHEPRRGDPNYTDFEAYRRRTEKTAKCSVGQHRNDFSECSGGLELHHSHIEFSLTNGVNLAWLEVDYPGVSDPDHVGKWVESADNLLWLCEWHHRGAGGVHVASSSDYEAEHYVAHLISDEGNNKAMALRMSSPRPDYNEYANWCENSNDRGGTPVSLFIIHTEEGGSVKDGAQNLSDFLISTTGGPNPVSYHFVISEDPDDHGVTLIDCVPTGQSAWAVGAANDSSINICFAGSTINWTTDEWMEQSNAIDVAAFVAVRECLPLGIPLRTMPPPYTGFDASSWGVTDHFFVTSVIGWGSHSDTGPNFPWAFFAERIAYWQNQLADPTQTTYTVARGDSVTKIAKRFSITVADLLAANPAITNPNLIKVGQVLVIPPAARTSVLRGLVQGMSARISTYMRKLGA